MKTEELLERAVKFHGHACPGLSIGVMAARYILEHGNIYSQDEELVAVVENDNCSVDALQVLLGTTFGKGNLIFRDYGKNNYTFFNRTKQKGVRLSAKPGGFGDKSLSKEERMKKILGSAPEDIFTIQEIEYTPPEFAKIHESIICSSCGEAVMATRIMERDGKKLCIPCYEKIK